MAELRGTGIHFGQPTYNQNGSETNNNTYQGRAPAIVKVGYGSADDTDQNVTGSSGATGVITGTEVNMGVPQASDNLYRINYWSIVNDNDGSTSGVGWMVYRYTPSAGWELMLAQGSHASYDSGMGDWYRPNNGIFYIPVHPSYPNESHSFRLHYNKHNVGALEINCSIGGWVTNGNLFNNTYEVWEINRDIVTDVGNFNPNF